MRLAQFALRNDKVISFVIAVLALLGVRSYLTTAQSIFPNMSFSRIDVVVDAGDLPPDQVRARVARPLEQALQGLPAVTQVNSVSSQGTAEAIVEFSPQTDPRADLAAVDQALGELRSALPDAKNLVAVIVNPYSEPVLSYALTSPLLSPALLREIARTQILPKLYGVPGLGRVLLVGGPAIEYHVDLDPAALAARGLSAADVTKAVADANAVTGVGVAQRYYQRYALIVDASLHGVDAVKRIDVPLKDGASVPLSALANVRLGVAPPLDAVSMNGRQAVIFNAYELAGADSVRMAREFRAKLDAVIPALPRDVHVRNFWDETTLIVESQASLRDSILLGALLAVVIIFAFLRDLRLTLVAAAVIPLAMSIAVFALGTAGETLNLMSVGGLAVAVGLIIDDAIVVVENIARNMNERPAEPPSFTIAVAMSQISAPMLASTTTTVVVFLPLALLSGVTGYFFRSLAFTLSAAIVVSLGLALLLAPIVARAVLGDRAGDAGAHETTTPLQARYETILRWSLAHRGLVYVASGAVLLATYLLMSRLPSDFLPKMDEGQFEIAYTMPVGTSLAASDAAATRMEGVITADPAVAAVGRFTGIDTNGYSPTQANQGLLRVRLIDQSKRDGYETVSERLRKRLQDAVPSSNFDFHQILEDLIDGLSGVKAPIEIAIRGSDQDQLIALANQVTDAIGKVRGVVDPFNGVTYDDPSVRIAPSGRRLAALGLSAGDISDALTAQTQGVVATSVTEGTRVIPVRVRVQSAQLDPGALGTTSVFLKGGATALGDVAGIATVRLSSEREARNGQPIVRVTANTSGVTLSEAVTGVRDAIARISFPPGYSAQIGGQSETQAQSFAEFVNVIAIAVLLVFAVMLATFKSYRLPVVILTAIPLALIGVALGLSLTGTPINVSSFMGLLLLVGLVVKNGILLIDVANKRVADGASVDDALATAGRTRLRPILMTTLAAIGGLLPLAVGIGQGAEMERPLAIAVIGGLSTATVFTLVLIPVLYAAIVGTSAPLRARPEAAVTAGV